LAADEMLDPLFTSVEAGIALQPPVDATMQRRGGGDEIVRFYNDEQKWSLIVSRIPLGEAMPLVEREQQGDKLVTRGGFVGVAVGQMPTDVPGEVLRAEFVPIGGYDGAILATRYTQQGEKRLQQQAIVQRTEKLYYVLTFNCAISDADRIEEDPGASLASEIFQAVVDSVELVDQQAIRADQDERLFRTRSLFVNWNESKLRSVLVEKQFLRLIRDGKDIGYTYAIEELADDMPRAGRIPAPANPDKPLGVRIGVRSRTVPAEGLQVDAESWMWVSFDRRNESFSNLVVTSETGQPNNFAMERGTSTRREGVVPELVKRPGEIRGQIEEKRIDQYDLEIWSVAKQQALPSFKQQLPPYYVPQALGFLLPRLVPLNDPKSYLFATYVSERRAVLLRYLDVERPEQTTFAGQSVVAIPIRDRLGIEGSVTTHYYGLEGKYLGSMNPDTQITIVPTDEETILEIWKGADLSPPKDVKQD
jgi:hypothetical protein